MQENDPTSQITNSMTNEQRATFLLQTLDDNTLSAEEFTQRMRTIFPGKIVRSQERWTSRSDVSSKLSSSVGYHDDSFEQRLKAFMTLVEDLMTKGTLSSTERAAILERGSQPSTNNAAKLLVMAGTLAELRPELAETIDLAMQRPRPTFAGFFQR